MKKFFSAMVSLFLVCSFTACTASTDVSKQQTENTTITDTGITISEKTPETTVTEAIQVDVTEGKSSENEKTTERKETTSEEKRTSTTQKQTDSTSGTTKKSVTTTKKAVTTTKKAITTTKKAVTTTKKAVTTTKKAVTTTKKQQTTAPSKKLPAYTPEAEIVSLFNKVNDYRAQNGLKKLTMDSSLCKIAYLRTIEQRTLKGHTRPDGAMYYTIFAEYGYNYQGCGENIAFYYNVSVDEIFEKWKNSSSHNKNLLDKRWTKSGMAMCKNPDGTYTIVHLFSC